MKNFKKARKHDNEYQEKGKIVKIENNNIY